MKIFFNSSMPRSGSTLLQNILGNNPDFYATPTSGVVEMLLSSRKQYTTSPVFKAQDETEMKKAFLTYCRFGLEGYFTALTECKYAIDKSRAWAINWAYLDSFYPDPKMICMVRDLRDIITSMEKNYRKYPEKHDPSQDDPPKGVTVGERVSNWMSNKPVGTMFKSLKEVINRGLDKNILFVRFEDLCEDPSAEMRKVYEFLQVPYYQHDFNNIKQVTHEDDKFHGRYGDHKIKGSVKPVPTQAEKILGEFICNQLYEKNEWYFKYFNYLK